jgi:hypothetical protein
MGRVDRDPVRVGALGHEPLRIGVDDLALAADQIQEGIVFQAGAADFNCV